MRPVMKSASPYFCYLICIGGFLLLLSNISASLDIVEYPGTCWTTTWLTACGFTLMMASLFIKQWRVSKIFALNDEGSISVVKISNKDVAGRIGLVMLANVTVLTAWMLLQGKSAVARRDWRELASAPIEGAEEVHEYVMACSLHPAGLYVLIPANVVMVLWGTLLAFRSRNIIMLMFNESRYMAMCTYNFALTSIMGGPVLLLSTYNPTTSLIVRTTGTFILVMAMVVTLFGFKVYLIQTRSISEIQQIMQTKATGVSTDRGMSISLKPTPRRGVAGSVDHK